MRRNHSVLFQICNWWKAPFLAIFISKYTEKIKIKSICTKLKRCCTGARNIVFPAVYPSLSACSLCIASLCPNLLPLQISPHSQFDDHRRFSAYPSLTFPAVLLIALFIKHSSNSFLRRSIRILLSLCSLRRHCTTFPPTALVWNASGEKPAAVYKSVLFHQSFLLHSQPVQNLQQNLFLIEQQRISFLYQSALSSSICVVYMWSWTIIKTAHPFL